MWRFQSSRSCPRSVWVAREQGSREGACHGVESHTDPTYSLNHQSRGRLPTADSVGAAQSAVPAAGTTPLASRSPERNHITQQFCPVTGAKLGSMSNPVPVVVGEHMVYVCCAGCVAKVEQNPEIYLPTSRASWSPDSDDIQDGNYTATNNLARLPADKSGACSSSSCCH